MEKLKYILFGTGIYYERFIDKVKEYVNIVALLDNSDEKKGTIIDGIIVNSPENIGNIEYDRILLLAENISARQMYNQLVLLGVETSKIQFVDEFFAEHCYDIFKVYNGKKIMNHKKTNNIGILAIPLGYDGSSIAICNMARVLVSCGNKVSLIVADANAELIRIMTDAGVDIVICPGVGCIGVKTLDFLETYDFFIINTFSMIDAVVKCRLHKKVIWWIHEANISYQNVFARYPNYKTESFDNVDIYAVSAIAKKNFNIYYPNQECGLLPYAIKDYTVPTAYNKNIIKRNSINKKIIFAMIANFAPLKAQKELLIATSDLEKKYRDIFEVWIIGKYNSTLYSRQVLNMAEKMSHVIIMGERRREEIRSLYREIDVIVCPSYEETMSIVVTEGFLNCKTCIVSNNTGSALFMHDRIDGLICEAGDAKSVAECMEWCLMHKNKLDEIGNQARIIYNVNFTEDILKKRMKKILEKMSFCC